VTKKLTDDALEMEFKSLVEDKPSTNQYQSTVTNNGYSTKINLSALPTLNPAAAASKGECQLHMIATLINGVFIVMWVG
jgi:hypothetical protein